MNSTGNSFLHQRPSLLWSDDHKLLCTPSAHYAETYVHLITVTISPSVSKWPPPTLSLINLWRLIVCVNLTGWTDVQITDKTSFLGVSMSLFKEEIWIHRFRKKQHLSQMWVGIIQFAEGPNTTRRQRKNEFSLFVSWDSYLLLSLNNEPPGSWAFGLGLNRTTSSPGSPACRQQTVIYLCFHNHMSHFP